MIIRMRAVTVHEVPGQVSPAEERAFLRDLQTYLETRRPCLVLDCSRIRRMNNATIHLLLSCLEEAMKRNGDVKLASVRPEAKATLRLAGVHRLFEMYATPADAVRRYQQHPASVVPPAIESEESDRDSENAV